MVVFYHVKKLSVGGVKKFRAVLIVGIVKN